MNKTIALFNTEAALIAASPFLVVDGDFESKANGRTAIRLATGKYLVQLGGRSNFHMDADNSDGWQEMERSGQILITQNGGARYVYYWTYWL